MPLQGFVTILCGGIRTARLKSGAVLPKELVVPWARRDFRPTRIFGPAARWANTVLLAPRF
jgi:hypothetical protein